eukprot:CAMPEP_0178933564 /NCGR_PEP_ID=MMETSP0786-20121207/23344_1 /TAXON_ID=186022 /ORGANISM="Thalassionema frauenfeldii, Strain CCMP 1798" /LENGTH=259 /DNA_ID=CAMNT_0020611183 /DNA_START=118 /DNA_END=897 /DNA_ORIENTATION=-
MFRRHRNEDDAFLSGLKTHLDCRILPHGFYPLIPTILSSMALWTSTVQDGCDYGRLEGEESISRITGSDVFPFLEVGLYNYRAPVFYATENEWKLAFTYDCQDYPNEIIDTWWTIGKYLTIASAVLAGTLSFFLWFTTCTTFSVRTWRFCGIQAFLAAIFRAGSFFFFTTSICIKGNAECLFSFGSKVDILGIILWILAGFTIMGHYPDPKLRKAALDDVEAAEEMANLQPKQLMLPGQMWQGGDLSARQTTNQTASFA